jgi:hypothetical protein
MDALPPGLHALDLFHEDGGHLAGPGVQAVALVGLAALGGWVAVDDDGEA